MIRSGPSRTYRTTALVRDGVARLPTKRAPDTGRLKPLRPRPADFRDTYIRNGWAGPEGAIERIFRTNWRVISRWIDEEGREALKAARRAHVRKHGRAYLYSQVLEVDDAAPA